MKFKRLNSRSLKKMFLKLPLAKVEQTLGRFHDVITLSEHFIILISGNSMPPNRVVSGQIVASELLYRRHLVFVAVAIGLG